MKEAKPKNSSQLVCVQVRIGGARPNVPFDQKITPRNFSNFYWKYVRENLLNNLTSDYRIFVTADTESVEKEAIKEFGEDKVVVIEGVSTHVDREANMREDCSRYEKIVMDFWMLGYCDKALVSDSGFGIFGVLRNRIPDKDFYILSALSSNFKKPEIFPFKKFKRY